MTTETLNYQSASESKGPSPIYGRVGVLLLVFQIPWCVAAFILLWGMVVGDNELHDLSWPRRTVAFLVYIFPSIVAILLGTAGLKRANRSGSRLPSLVSIVGGSLICVYFMFSTFS